PTAATFGWTVTSASAPDTAITSAPAASTTSTSATFAFMSTPAGATFECALDAAGFVSCPTPVTFSSLAVGGHTFQVRAVNGGGTDATPAQFTWTITPLPPDTSITSAPSAFTTSTSASFSFTSTPSGATFQCALDAAAFAACTSPQNLSGLAVGSPTFQVRASDANGTDPTPAAYAWTVLSSPPDTTITSSPASSTTSTSASFSFTSTPSGATFQCALDGAAF